MRTPILLLNNSMPLTVYIYLVAYAPLLLCSSISCLILSSAPPPPLFDVCKRVHKCGRFDFAYPFGQKNSGCGDPEFQFDHCHQPDRFPLLNISGDQYRILEPSLLANNSNNNTITIINDNLLVDKCNLSGNYSQFWSSASHFHIADSYSNLTLWKHCDENKLVFFLKLHLCNDNWYYFSGHGPKTSFCQTHLQLPIKKFLIGNQHTKNPTLQINQTFLGQGFLTGNRHTKNPTLQINQTFLGQGFQIKWYVDTNRYRRCGACLKSSGSCGYNISKPTTFLCYCPDGTSHLSKCPGRGIVTQNSSYASDTEHPNKTAIIIGSSFGGGALITITLVLFLVYFLKNRKSPPRGGLAGHFHKDERKGMQAFVPGHERGNLPIFSYEELCQATNCFHEDHKLGVVGFGSVYLGKLRDGRSVAIKRLYHDNSRRIQQFINEVEIFSSLSHPQLVRLFGCTSADSLELLLVYEFVSNGTLADHLHGDRKGPWGLPWNTRFNITIQTAQALAFLHSLDPPILHRDVKSSNILLDENLDVKLADFGLCRLVPVDASHVTTIPQGTPGYVDPQYYQCYQLTEKSDVYSFGVVLVEIISAKVAMDINRNRREINLANLAVTKIQEGALHELLDPQLDIEVNHEVKVGVSAVAELAFRCLASETDDRPHMKEIVAELEVIRGLWSACPNTDEYRGSFPNSKQPLSPTSVQDNWPSFKLLSQL